MRRKKFIAELLNPDPVFNWESTEFKKVGDDLIKEGKDLAIHKELPRTGDFHMFESPEVSDDE